MASSRRIFIACLLGGLLTAGCAVPPAVRTPAVPKPVHPQPELNSPAVLELSKQARQAMDERRFEEAAQLLERAVDIEPRNGSLWHELARVRFRQGNYEQAMELANRSNALADTGPALKSRNDELIKASRNALGY